MRVKMILPALMEASNPRRRSIKYSLFPPLGLATLAGYLDDSDDVVIEDEHVERVGFDDEPELVVIEVYVTSAYRSYEIADRYRANGAYVAMGGLHVTSMPEEAASHADTIFLGPGEDTWPEFLRDFSAGVPRSVYKSKVRTLHGQPSIRRDLIKTHLYLVPNSLVVSRGCPHSCDFCYKEAFFEGGRSFYTQTVDDALSQIEGLPGRHLFFLDDNLFSDRKFAAALFDGMKGMRRIWQAAGTVKSIFDPGLMEKARECGLRSLFVGFETLSSENLVEQRKHHNVGIDYGAAVRRLHDMGVMINGSFVLGLDSDDEDTARRTAEWVVEQGIETATFHILTPYPGTALFERLKSQGRITSTNWDIYDTKHVVFKPARMDPGVLEAQSREVYKYIYSWPSIFKSAWVQEGWRERLRHLAYSGGWRKMGWFWDPVIKSGSISRMKRLFETVLDGGAGRSVRGRLGGYRPIVDNLDGNEFKA